MPSLSNIGFGPSRSTRRLGVAHCALTCGLPLFHQPFALPPPLAASQALRGMGHQCTCEQLLGDGLFSVDILLEHADTKHAIVVEVDGPHHYAKNDPAKPLGEAWGQVPRHLDIRRHACWGIAGACRYQELSGMYAWQEDQKHTSACTCAARFFLRSAPAPSPKSVYELRGMTACTTALTTNPPTRP